MGKFHGVALYCVFLLQMHPLIRRSNNKLGRFQLAGEHIPGRLHFVLSGGKGHKLRQYQDLHPRLVQASAGFPLTQFQPREHSVFDLYLQSLR